VAQARSNEQLPTICSVTGNRRLLSRRSHVSCMAGQRLDGYAAISDFVRHSCNGRPEMKHRSSSSIASYDDLAGTFGPIESACCSQTGRSESLACDEACDDA
jgi:hypothetical protein